ncbi:MAG: proprotein convertase P-domain-containing protein [Polyangiaceae bacterium]|nr:proprotein convertase P-domain-containing protein [Polyangiaceae bacterium]
METTSRNRMRGAFWSFVAVAVLTTGCELITAPDRKEIPGEGGSGGTAGSAGTTSTGGTTSMAECSVAEDCPAVENECLVRACVEAKCTPEPVAAGTAVAEQTDGNCEKVVCDGSGSTTTQADDSDLPADGNDCTNDVCTNGIPSNPPVTEGSACGAQGALYCNAAGQCVTCLTDDQCGTATDCSTPVCNAGVCETQFAAPGTPTPMQTDGDCLEVQCNGIGGTKSIVNDADVALDTNQCTLDFCQGGTLVHPNSPSGATCTDNNGQVCDGAGNCIECLSGANCTSGVCISQVCAAPTCMDVVKNGNETDTDCGGADCPKCANLKSCSIAGDCTSGVCTTNVCQVPTCGDTVKNGNETDIDCGGNICTKCGPGLACSLNTDCVGGSCQGNTCVPTCTDLVKNGTESDIDCGGTCATKCAAGKVCGVNADCVTGSCIGNVCQPPACNDNAKNGTETDIDCGGGACPDCIDGKVCSVNGDCVSNLCQGNVCTAPVCTDGLVQGNEQCDDTNTTPGDGCNATCQCESTQVVTVDPSPDLAIPDDAYTGTLATMGCVDVPLTAQCNITSMTVTVGMSHTWIGDLVIKLVHPDNTVITLMSRPGSAEATDNGTDAVFGDSSNLVKSHPVTFQTGAATSAESMGAGIGDAGNVCQDNAICTYAPANGAAAAGNLDTLIGKKANGTWKFCAGDSVSGDTGEIDVVTLTVNQ